MTIVIVAWILFIWFVVALGLALITGRYLHAKGEEHRRWQLAQWQERARELERASVARQFSDLLRSLAAAEPEHEVYRPPEEWVPALVVHVAFRGRGGRA